MKLLWRFFIDLKSNKFSTLLIIIEMIFSEYVTSYALYLPRVSLEAVRFSIRIIMKIP